MINLMLDTQGKLVQFEALPPQVEENATPAKPVEWNPLFVFAGLDPAQLQAATPQWTSLASTDTRAAWTGKLARQRTSAARRSRRLARQTRLLPSIGPWSRPERMRPFEDTSGRKISQLSA